MLGRYWTSLYPSRKVFFPLSSTLCLSFLKHNYLEKRFAVQYINMSAVSDPTMTASAEDVSIPRSPLLFEYNEDKYDGIIVSSKFLPQAEEKFEEMLVHSISYWKANKRRGVWIKIPLEKSSLIPIAVKHGFVFHHAERDYVMLTHWLSDEQECRLPANASHQVGVGCVVIHPVTGQLLLVQEKNGPLKGAGVWKIPTGLCDASEDIEIAAEREVKEETGINAKFSKLLAFRQAHNISFGKSDLFFLCVLTPESFDISLQEAEIHDCAWKEPEILTNQSFFRKSPLHSVLNQKIQHEVRAVLGKADPQPALITKKLALGFLPQINSLYYFESKEDVLENTKSETANENTDR
jgi:ADP-ribose pyrophosphatase YjhB (NUDIX family)